MGYTYDAKEFAGRALVDGRYNVYIKEAKEGKPIATGKYAGAKRLEMRMRVLDGEMEGMEMVVSTVTEGALRFTTNKIIKSVFPAIQQGQNLEWDQLVGGKLEIQIKTRLNEKNGQQSMYVDFIDAWPLIASPGSFADFGPSDVT
jgi:hypothetical protein